MIDRFLAKVKKTDSCWLWTASSNGHGYGQFAVSRRLGKPLAAHRVSFVIHVGPIPKGMFVLHRCDIPACVNPQHLFLGNQKDNMQDRIAKGRQPKGYKHKNPKTQCSRGHRWTKENTRLRPGRRYCNACNTERSRERRARLRRD